MPRKPKTRRRPVTRVALATLTVLLVVAGVACGGDDDDGGETGTGATAAETTTTSQPCCFNCRTESAVRGSSCVFGSRFSSTARSRGAC